MRDLTMVNISDRDCLLAKTWAEGASGSGRSGSGACRSKDLITLSLASLDSLSAILRVIERVSRVMDNRDSKERGGGDELAVTDFCRTNIWLPRCSWCREFSRCINDFIRVYEGLLRESVPFNTRIGGPWKTIKEVSGIGSYIISNRKRGSKGDQLR
jgi:hypothetical protein